MFKRFSNVNLAVKFIVPICSIALLCLVITGYLLLTSATQSMHKQVEIAESALKNEQRMAENMAHSVLLSKTDREGTFMAQAATDLIISYDYTTLEVFQSVASSDNDIEYAVFLKPNKSPILPDFQLPEKPEGVVEKFYNIVYDNETIGSVRIGFSLSQVNKNIEESNLRINNELDKVRLNGQKNIDNFLLMLIIVTVVLMAVIASSLYYLFELFVLKPTRETTQRMDELSSGAGDLTYRLPVIYKDEIGNLRRSVNGFIENLHGLVSNLVADIEKLSDEATHLRQGGNDLAVAADSQRVESSQIASSINEMSVSIQEVAKSSNTAADVTKNAFERTALGRQVVHETVATINELSMEVENATSVIHGLAEDSNRIGSVIDVIRGIADQTNLLALNAAIEAARAGEQGRGFSVVADEVRTLASRTQQSTTEIHDMISRVQSGAINAVTAMDKGREKTRITVEKASQTGSTLEDISASVESINQMNSQIAAAVVQQSVVAEEINENIINIHDTSEKTSESATHFAESGNQLSALSNRLKELTAQFKV